MESDGFFPELTLTSLGIPSLEHLSAVPSFPEAVEPYAVLTDVGLELPWIDDYRHAA